MGIDWLTGSTFLLSLCYIWLAIRNSKYCYIFAVVGSLLWAYADFSMYNLKFDGVLQLFYAIMAIYGYYTWDKQDRTVNSAKQISKLNHFANLTLVVTSIVGSLILVLILEQFTTTKMPYLDAWTTLLAVIGTFLLIFRFIDSWIYLTLSNVIYIYIYYTTDATLFIGIMIIYIILATIGYIKWLGFRKN